MKIVLFTVPGSPPLIANILKEETDYLTVEYPLALMKDTPNVYTFQYMPFANGGVVVFKTSNIVSVATVNDEIKKYYNDMVDLYKNQKLVFKLEDGDEQEEDSPMEKIVNKSLH